MPHLRSLDGLRGVAVLGVVLYHFAPSVLPGGFLGVDVFFVLSGFLITSLLVREWEHTRRVSLQSFWVRRARRLLPALFVVLAAVGVWALFVANHVDAHHVADDGLAAFSYVANWHFISSGQSYIQRFTHAAPSPLLHTWSLAIEEQFYLVWPLVVTAVGAVAARRSGRAGRQRRRFQRVLLGVCLVLGAASLARMVSLYHPGADPSRVYYGTDTRAFVLLVGAAIGAVTAGAPAIARRHTRALVVLVGLAGAAGLGAAMAFVTAQARWLYAGGYGLVALLIGLVLVAAAQPGANPLRRLLETRPIVGLGLISYGVYLWHWPVFVWMTSQNTGTSGVGLFALRAAVTLAVSLASYYLVEQPIRRGRLPSLRLQNRGIVPAALITAVALSLLVPSIAFPSVAAAPTALPSATTSAVNTAYSSAPRCDTPATPPPPTRLRVQLLGNSIAKEASPCLKAIFARQGIALQMIAQDAAGLCDDYATMRSSLTNPAKRPDVAVIFAIPVKLTACSEQQSWTAQVRQALDAYRRAGVPVYLVPDVPKAATVGPAAVAASYEAFSKADPARVGLLDAGVFLRDQTGVYQWRMPCVAGGEVGCRRDGTIAVRDPADGGAHFCADPFWRGATDCGATFSGGDRRVASALAEQLLAFVKPKP